jgi:signal peptidase I
LPKLKEAVEEKRSEAKKPEKHKETTMEFIASMASILVVGLFIITFCLQAFEIPSSSMENTLLIGDHVFVDRVTPAPKTNWFPIIPYREVHRNDIVVFLSPSTPGLFVVKRVIGIPGDRLHLKDGKLYRNGEQVNEPYVIRKLGDYQPYRDDFPTVSPLMGAGVTPEWNLIMSEHIKNGELVVPANSYFGMGDNRDESYDSRFWGFIPKENVVGRPMVIYWSFETPRDQYTKTAWSERIKFIGNVVLHFFSDTRWKRMFHLVK